jgi:GNAT superfamily N-acetyltransferase
MREKRNRRDAGAHPRRNASSMPFHLRLAIPGDTPALTALIQRSVRELQKFDYSPEQLEVALEVVFGVDSQLIADGTYFAVTPEDQSALIVGCGGWSRRQTLYGGDRWSQREDSFLDPARDAAKIRAFFVHPAWSRRGIGSLILDTCEAAARADGFTRLEMGATFTGVPLYAAHGYVERERVEVPLRGSLTLPIVRMEKSFDANERKSLAGRSST